MTHEQQRPDGDLVRQKREERGWTQEGLAGKAGVDVQTLRRIERGEGVRRQSLNRVANALGSSIDDLLGVTLKSAARVNHGDANLLAGITISLTLPIRKFGIERSLTLSGSRTACPPSALLESGASGPGRWIVLGEAGAGKTTLLRQLAYDLSSDDSPLLPVLIRLGELAQQRNLELEPEALLALEPEAARRQLRSAATRGKVVLLLDGLDEVSPVQREWVRSLLRVAVASWPCPTIVTSRPHGLRRPGGFEVARLDPLNDAQITEFLGRWFESRPTESPSHAGLDVLLTAGSEMWEVMRNPLLMTFVVLLSERRALRGDQAWPRTRQELYDQVLVVLLEGLHRLENAPSVADPEAVVDALAFLAAELTNDGAQAEPRASLAARLRGHPELWAKIARVPRWAEGPGEFLNEVADRCGVLAEHDGRNTQWRFWHRSLQESLAAKHLRRGLGSGHTRAVLARAERLDRAGSDAHWIEPYILLCGELSAADELVQRLLRADPEIAVRGVENARRLSESTLRDVVEALAVPPDGGAQARSFLEAMRNWWSAVGDDARPGLVKGIEYQLGGWIGDDARAQAQLERLTTALQRRYVDPIEVDECMERLTRTLPSFTGPLRGAVYLQLGRLLPRPEAVELVMSLWDRALERGQGVAEDLFFLDEALGRIYEDDAAIARPRDDLYGRLAAPPPDLVRWRPIPPGTFQLGSPKAEGGFHWERPQHQVEFTRGWEATETLITNAQFAVFDPHHRPPDGQDPAAWAALPVVGVSWYGAVAFARWLARLGHPCRLPTEAEWEYMARAGTTTPFSSGSTEDDLARVGWYRVNAEGRLHPVGSKDPNPWGLFDIHGNAYEWTQDWYGPYAASSETDPTGPSYGRCRILRGGCFDWDAPWARSAHRSWLPPNAQLGNIGVRVIRDSTSAIA